MAVTELALLFIGALAVVATAANLVSYNDRWTPVVISFVAVILWGTFGLSAFDVRVSDTANETILPLVWLGFGFAIATGMLWLWQLKTAMAEEAGAEKAPGIIR